jgi:hypothetical protein
MFLEVALFYGRLLFPYFSGIIRRAPARAGQPRSKV